MESLGDVALSIVTREFLPSEDVPPGHLKPRPHPPERRIAAVIDQFTRVPAEDVVALLIDVGVMIEQAPVVLIQGSDTIRRKDSVESVLRPNNRAARDELRSHDTVTDFTRDADNARGGVNHERPPFFRLLWRRQCLG